MDGWEDEMIVSLPCPNVTQGLLCLFISVEPFGELPPYLLSHQPERHEVVTYTAMKWQTSFLLTVIGFL